MKKSISRLFPLLLTLLLLAGCGASPSELPSGEETVPVSTVTHEIPPLSDSVFHGPLRYLGSDWVEEISVVSDMSDGSSLITYHLAVSRDEAQELLLPYIETHLLGEVGLTETMRTGFDLSDEDSRIEFYYPDMTPLSFKDGNPEQVSMFLLLDSTFLCLRFSGDYGVIEDFLAPEPEPAPEPAPEPDEDSSESSSGGGWVDCPSCYSGKCTACNGRGGKDSYSPGLPREWDECWKCYGDGKCDRCDGFGKILG